MGKITLFLLPLLFIGCEQTFDAVIDSFQNNYQVISVNPTDSISYRADDSLGTISIRFEFGSEVGNVSCDIIASDDSKLNNSPFPLFDDNGDNRFSNDFPFSTLYPNGIYHIKYYVRNNSGSNQVVAVSKFKYINGQNNIPPVIMNTVIEPDTVTVTSLTVIFTSVEAADSNGQNDIQSVYFIVYRPDGTTSGERNFLYDDGEAEEHGDVTAGDSIYSLLIRVEESNAKGTYRFEFRAKDRGGKLSNIINHFVLIQ